LNKINGASKNNILACIKTTARINSAVITTTAIFPALDVTLFDSDITNIIAID
jgi:hypothetical protein